MTVRTLFIKPRHGAPAQDAGSLALTAANGITGDCFCGSGDRQLCLISGNAQDKLTAARGKGAPCVKRFSCNMVIDGLCDLKPGAVLSIGGTVLCITQAGRECHGLCTDTVQRECALARDIYFACVRRDGVVCRGDTVVVEENG